MKIFLGADHRGFAEKQALFSQLSSSTKDIEVIDQGAHNYDPEDDFNDCAIAVAKNVIQNPGSLGILICGSAHGVCMQANRFKGVRAIVGYNPQITKLGREHNHANVLCLSADHQSSADLAAVVQTFLNTEALNEPRYQRRNQRLDEEIL